MPGPLLQLPTRPLTREGPDAWKATTAKINICFCPTAMFTQDYPALGELETNWRLAHLDQSPGAAWNSFLWKGRAENGAPEGQLLKST